MKNNYLISKLVLLNFGIACGLFYLYNIGVLIPAFTADASGIPFAILGLFLVGLISIFRFASNIVMDNIHVKFEFVRDIGEYLVTLGLIGTCMGLLALFNGVDLSLLGNPEGLSTVGKSLKNGISVLSYNTIIAALAWIAHSVNARMVLTQIDLNNPD